MLTLPGTIFAQNFSKRHTNDWLVVFYAVVGKIAKYNYNNDGIEYCEAFLFLPAFWRFHLYTHLFSVLQRYVLNFMPYQTSKADWCDYYGTGMWLLWHRNVTMEQKCGYGTGMWVWNRNVSIAQECDYYGTGMWVRNRNVAMEQECDYYGTGMWVRHRNVSMAQECEYSTGMWLLWHRNVTMEQECDYNGTGMWLMAQECD